jgi:hypothetical protein
MPSEQGNTAAAEMKATFVGCSEAQFAAVTTL